jgi:hypothetical protein
VSYTTFTFTILKTLNLFGLRNIYVFYIWLHDYYYYVTVHSLMIGGACSSDGLEESRVQVFGGEIWGKETTGETQV